jgi:hypothetical protein
MRRSILTVGRPSSGKVRHFPGSTLGPKGGTMSRYTLVLIVLAALSLAAFAGNIIWGD